MNQIFLFSNVIPFMMETPCPPFFISLEGLCMISFACSVCILLISFFEYPSVLLITIKSYLLSVTSPNFENDIFALKHIAFLLFSIIQLSTGTFSFQVLYPTADLYLNCWSNVIGFAHFIPSLDVQICEDLNLISPFNPSHNSQPRRAFNDGIILKHHCVTKTLCMIDSWAQKVVLLG